MRSILAVSFLLISFWAQGQKSAEVASALQYQEKMNRDFRDPKTSPLPPAELAKFTGLDFFPVDTAFIVAAQFVRTPFEIPFAMPTTTERRPVYVKYGELYFSLGGTDHKLNVYQSQDLRLDPEYADYLFLPFTDLTNGNSTYSGGRYLDMRIPDSDKIILNFNKSYNPYCAYSGEYSCPIPPEENHLSIPVEAGVKAFK